MENVKLQRLQALSAIFALFGVLDSVYLWSFKWTGQLICSIGECESVNTSPYAMLLGVPVAAIGAAGYAALLALAVWAFVARDHAPAWLNDARLAFAGIGAFFAAYLTVIEVFVIHAIWMWCVLQAAAILAILIGILVERRRERAAE